MDRAHERCREADGPHGLRAICRWTAAVSTLTSVLWGVAIGALLGAAIALSGSSEPARQTETYVDVLYREYQCWRNDGLKHPEPQGALATLPKRGVRIYPAKVGYRIWLEDAPGTLHAFCKKGPQ